MLSMFFNHTPHKRQPLVDVSNTLKNPSHETPISTSQKITAPNTPDNIDKVQAKLDQLIKENNRLVAESIDIRYLLTKGKQNINRVELELNNKSILEKILELKPRIEELENRLASFVPSCEMLGN